MKPFAIDDGISENTFSNANDHNFITYVMKVDSDQMISQVSRRSALSDNTLALLNSLMEGKMIPRTSDMKNIFLALGISDIPFPEDMKVLEIHTMQNDKLVALFKGDEFPVLVANTFSQE